MKKYITPELKALNLIAEQAFSFDDEEEGILVNGSTNEPDTNDTGFAEW